MALAVGNPPANPGAGSTPGSGDALEEGMAAYCSVLAWRMDRGAWRATVHGVTKSRTRWKQLSTHTYWALGPKRVGNIVLEGGFPFSSASLLREKALLRQYWRTPHMWYPHEGGAMLGMGPKRQDPQGRCMPVGGESEQVPFCKLSVLYWSTADVQCCAPHAPLSDAFLSLMVT